MRLVLIAVAISAGVSALSSLERRSIPYSCSPDQSCWPSKADWETFNSSVNGRLGLTEPWASPCYTDPTSADCKAVEQGYLGYDARQTIYGAMENLNWEVCGYENQCLLNSLDPSATLTQNCSLGRLSAYYVEVKEQSDIVNTLSFVREKDIRLSIKNTGHDYFGRSSTANSLALWTRGLQNIEFHDTFDQCQCKTGLQNIGIIGAGVTAGEAYDAFAKNGMHVVVGAVSSVGIAGGFGQGGGHGPLGPSYGLGVDQAVEFDVITADGEFKTINECNEPELFWAMRGGGGGTFAILVNYKLQLHPVVPLNVYAFEASILPEAQTNNLTQSTVLRSVVSAIANNQTSWSDNKIAGYHFFLPTSIISLSILPDNDTQKLQNLTADYKNMLANLQGVNVSSNEYKTLDSFPDYAAYALPYLATNGPVGVAITEATRLIPRALFDPTKNGPEALTDAFLAGLQTSLENGAGYGTGSGQIYATTPANQPDNSATGVNPAWRNSLWYVIHGGIWTSADNATSRANIARTPGKAIQYMKKLTPGGGTYLNEGDYLEEDWQQTFFGSNYDRLLAAKQKYDPTGLFSCWKCVGFDAAQDDKFYSCYKDEGGVPTMPQDPSQQPVAPVTG